MPSLTAGQTVDQAADAAFTSQAIDGTLIYVAQAQHKIYVLADRSAQQAGWITSQTASSIAGDIGDQIKAGNNDGALNAGVNDVLNIYRSHLSSAGGAATQASSSRSHSGSNSFGGFHVSWLIILIVGFFIVRTIFRPRYYGPPQGGAPGPGMPMGGYGGGGYGGGYGGGGNGFWTGLVGGLGGAWLGNQMFGGGGGMNNIGGGGNDGGAGGGGNTDGGGWTGDAGQIGGGGGSDWGGGGWGGGGGGDFGGGDGGGGGGW